MVGTSACAVAIDGAIVNRQPKTPNKLTGSPMKLERKGMMVNALHGLGDRGRWAGGRAIGWKREEITRPTRGNCLTERCTCD